MGYEILVVICMTVMLPVVVLGFVVYWWMTNRERAEIEATWEGQAARRGRLYVPARGEWPNRTSPSVRWAREEHRFALTIAGREGGARTRLIAWPRGRLAGGFAIAPRAGTAPDAADFFAAMFDVTEDPSGLSDRVLGDPCRRALLGFWQRQDVRLSYRHGRLTLDWPGREANESRIDEAELVVAEVARAVDAAFLAAARAH